MKDGLLIDTNLLLVMVIGGVDEGRYIKKSKRLGDFCVEDYHQLWELVKGYKEQCAARPFFWHIGRSQSISNQFKESRLPMVLSFANLGGDALIVLTSATRSSRVRRIISSCALASI